MPNGDELTAKRASMRTTGYGYKLLDAAGAQTDGQWVDVRDITSGSIHLFGTFDGTVDIRGSNAAEKPENSEHGIQIGSNLTAPALVAYSMPVRWVKARVTIYTSGSISVNFHGVA